MDKLIAVGIGIGLGWWLKARADERRHLRAENEALKARLNDKAENK